MAAASGRGPAFMDGGGLMKSVESSHPVAREPAAPALRWSLSRQAGGYLKKSSKFCYCLMIFRS
jgi:hypothetical protein